MTDTPKPLMTGTRAAALLEDILKWKLQLVTPEPGVRSVPTDTDGIRSPNRDALPFGLDHVIDTSWSDGPTGTTTEQGVDKWLRFWTPWMSYWAGVPAVWREKPGPWTLKQLTENPAFTAPNTWDEDDQTAWRDFTTELKTMWWKIGRETGNAPHNAGICPKCMTGTMQQHPRARRGYSDTAICNKCKATIPASDLKRSRRHAIRHITTTDDKGETWIYGKQALDLYGDDLTWAKLRDWHKQGKLDRKGKKRAYQYPLAQLNSLVLPSQ